MIIIISRFIARTVRHAYRSRTNGHGTYTRRPHWDFQTASVKLPFIVADARVRTCLTSKRRPLSLWAVVRQLSLQCMSICTSACDLTHQDWRRRSQIWRPRSTTQVCLVARVDHDGAPMRSCAVLGSIRHRECVIAIVVQKLTTQPRKVRMSHSSCSFMLLRQGTTPGIGSRDWGR